MQNIIVDSRMTEEEAFLINPLMPCPAAILTKQRVLDLRYWSFDGKMHAGQLVVDGDLADDVQKIFAELLTLRFLIAKMIPIAAPQYAWDDECSMQDDNTSAFNHRTIAGTDRLSWHAYGRAIDINPRRNPYIKDGVIAPEKAVYDPRVPGTITHNAPIVALFKKYGFVWGGEWEDRQDYQHFEKPLAL